MSAIKHPDFIVIGAPKCGTTAFFEFLGQHPQVRLSTVKEPHFFSYVGDRQPHWATKSVDEYAGLFSADDTRLQGEASTWYLYSPTAAATIKGLRPNVKLIAMLRNPVERAYSSYLFRLQNGWETCDSFKSALRLEKKRIAEGAEWDFHYAAAGLYYEQLQRYAKLFPAKQLKVILYDDFRKQPAECLRETCDFLGIDANFHFSTAQAINVTKPPLFPSINRFLVRHRAKIAGIRQAIPSSVYRQLTRIKRLNDGSRQPVGASLKRELIEYYRKDIDLLGALLQRDLRHWLE
jgi:hypothetical protein